MGLKGKINVAAISFVIVLTAGLQESDAQEKTKTTQSNTEGFFTLGEVDNHWWFITPKGEAFFSIGLNHIDLKY
jgi:hypothetical protein